MIMPTLGSGLWMVARRVLLLGLLAGHLAGAEAPVAGSFIRFRVDQLPPNAASLNLTGTMKVHASPWTHQGLKLTPRPVTEPGWTPWVNLAKLPGAAKGSLIINLPAGARGVSRFATRNDDAATVRDIPWDEVGGNRVIITPDFADLRSFRDQERRYYQRTLRQTGERLYPLTRPPLAFSNAWGYTTGGAAEYMVKSFRLLGFNSVVTSTDAALYERLYGWHSQEGQYSPPGFTPYDEPATGERFAAWYRDYFTTGKGKGASAGMRVFQLADEPGELRLTPEQATPPFRVWLAAQGLTPAHFGLAEWEGLAFSTGAATTAEDNRRLYWSRRYQSHLTIRRFALAAEAVRAQGPSPETQAFVALSGHAFYMPSKMPLDMFALARHPGLMPGISDWMTSGSWNWDSHQAVAFSVAPFNAGARRYDGQPPLSFPMMHCVNPSLFRAYTQLANQCKLISYYNYGPDYEVTEGFWSHSGLGAAVQRVNNQAAQVDDLLSPGLMRPSRVAMLYSMAQEIWWPSWALADKRASFLGLAHEYFQPELVTDEQVLAGALSHYDALFVLDTAVPAKVQQGIGAWVRAGGLLWTCADALACDEYKERLDLLKELTGIEREFSQPQRESQEFIPVAGETALRRHEVPPQGRSKEHIRPSRFTAPEGARVRAHYTDERPAWVELAVERGKVVYLGHNAGLSYSRRAGARGAFKWWPEQGQRDLLTVPLLEAGVRRELSLSAPMVMAMPLGTDAGTVIILYNMWHEPRSDLTVTLRELAPPHEVRISNHSLDFVDLPFTHADGVLTMTIDQLSGAGAMIVVRRQPAPPDPRPALMRQAATNHLAADDYQSLSAGAWFAGFHPEWQLAERLVPLVTHGHWAVRRSAAEALGRLHWQAAAPALLQALAAETDSHALAEQLHALALLRHPQAARLCQEHLTHAHPVVRQQAAASAKLLVE